MSSATISWTKSICSIIEACRHEAPLRHAQFEAQAVYWACGGRQNDVHRLDRDRDGWACEALP